MAAKNLVDGSNGERNLVEPFQLALNSPSPQVTLAAQLWNELFMVRPDLGRRRTMRASALAFQAINALALNRLHHLRRVGREIPQRRQIRQHLLTLCKVSPIEGLAGLLFP